MATATKITDSVFTCTGKLETCVGRPFYGEHEGKQYCVLHFPGKEKSGDFKKALQEKIKQKDFCFRGVWFPDPVCTADFGELDLQANFEYAIFTEAVHFADARFGERATFDSAKFCREAYFARTIWNGARFGGATFDGDVSFRGATFLKVANFFRASFLKRAMFFSAVFMEKANFGETIFADHVELYGEKKRSMFCRTSSLDLQFAKIEKPAEFSIRTVMLRPHWFLNVNAEKFQFTNVNWEFPGTSEEIDALKAKFVGPPHRDLAIACWRLADNAEENHRYDEASAFRYLAMDSRRLENWRGYAVWRLSWWYWLESGYGERVLRAFVVLLAIWLLAALSYIYVGFAKPLGLGHTFTYSAEVMMLQKPDPRPSTVAAETIVLLETIFGPAQAALLALAIRRKFMR